MKNNRTGLTLIELLVAIGIAAIVGGVATRQMLDAIRFSERSQETMEMERSKVGLQRELNHIWSRARILTSTAGVAGVGGYAINGVGGSITFSADLRPCVPEGVPYTNKYYNPLTAKNTNPLVAVLKSSYTLVSLACCAKAPVNQFVRNPYTGANFLVPSACKSGGITMNYRRFDRNDSYCYGDYARQNVNTGLTTIKTGVVGAGQGFGFTRMRFATVGLDHSRDSYTVVPLTSTAGNSSLTYIPNNAPNFLYYVSLISQEAFTTGGQGVNKKGEIQGEMLSGADIGNIIEMYGRLGNLPTSRLVDCGGGVERP